ncbi:MAG: CDP-archaeol synthase [Gammaproteobacteria bacterium]|nr:CDP-archaeol synthase [Gammaproteobacteria bacterium]
MDVVYLLLLIMIANGAPVLLHYVFNKKFISPIDFNYCLPDGRPLFGHSKTWRGLAGALLLSSVAAVLLGYSMETGFLVAIYSMAGDLLSSFVKRRMGIASSGMAPLLDQVPESLLPAIMLMERFQLDIWSIIIVVSSFIVLELLLSRILYQWGIRKKPF